MKKKGLFLIGMVLIIVTAYAKPPNTVVYDPSIPEEQTATLFLAPNSEIAGNGQFRVTHFNGKSLSSNWLMPNKNKGLIVRVPTTNHLPNDPGDCSITYQYANSYIKVNGDIVFIAVGGRDYILYGSGTAPSNTIICIYETSNTREPNSDEQVVSISNGAKFYHSYLIIFNKGTNNERRFLMEPKKELRIILPKGEYTIDVETPSKGLPITISEKTSRINVSTEPLRFSVKAQYVKDVGTVYNFTKQ